MMPGARGCEAAQGEREQSLHKVNVLIQGIGLACVGCDMCRMRSARERCASRGQECYRSSVGR